MLIVQVLGWLQITGAKDGTSHTFKWKGKPAELGQGELRTLEVRCKGGPVTVAFLGKLIRMSSDDLPRLVSDHWRKSEWGRKTRSTGVVKNLCSNDGAGVLHLESGIGQNRRGYRWDPS